MMPESFNPQFYLAVENTSDFLKVYREASENPEPLRAAVAQLLGLDEFEILALPSLRFQVHHSHLPSDAKPMIEARSDWYDVALARLVVAFRIADPSARVKFLKALQNATNPNISPNLPIYPLDHWCAGPPPDSAFLDRAAARALIHASALPADPSNDPVNVVVVDQGIGRPPGTGGGWDVDFRDFGLPIQAANTPSRHGFMMARNILNLAGGARLFDFPIIPAAIGSPATFLAFAYAAFEVMRVWIAFIRRFPGFRGPWVIVNAWGVLDRRWEDGLPLPNRYSDNKDHYFNRLIADFAGEQNDLIFAAGNCGQFCPDRRCGPRDIGPSRSIHGANSLPDVLTIGAVRSDTKWIGGSSQGPGTLKDFKPDLCAPSYFIEDLDPSDLNSGSSAACALAAGIVAGLRTRWHSQQVPPADLFAALRRSALKVNGEEYGERYGSGIVDVAAAVTELSSVVTSAADCGCAS
jgi:hypothetical protein